ncbi:NADH:ubiquinone oxidoreductase subunit F (NADH-binding) [Jatrophihabitans sp. GAS493]|uniref:NADH-ubiquinone oxidoreductase-F iron-sulfur binding region domain-containing protein n=1 Tax=Jatrophihabitans sp. GAS493 TaxID=1907575 RepID=UPI000BB813B1|nr:NADH-ubiquinone oxidoreductase-F iron-sulfur binding region domain-containing protein [Jatrophihabitans sp. GAS493]SOD70624.1 NADH:ubiquinone oxidoreductase subunit F (NADH-binding) [Jatrophihabitans sp. GAS493]
MTLLASRPETAASVIPVSSIGAPRLLRGLDRFESISLADHAALHGPLPMLDRIQLVSACRQVNLTGRGGAGFPFADKVNSLRTGAAAVVVVNGSESEPASWKDRALMRRTPHLVLDGAVVTAHAIGAREIIVACHDALAAQRLNAAIAERRAMTGRHGRAASIRVQTTRSGFVGGEAGALMQTLNAAPGIPTGRRVLPTMAGVAGAPTLASNVETFAQIAILARMGSHHFGETGAQSEPGTMLLTVGGSVAHSGVLEVPTGTPLSIVLAASGASQHLQGVILGGYHGSWHQPIGSIRLSRAGVHAAGGSLGAGVVLAVDDTTCALGELQRVTNWLAEQSARQCGPCRFGLPALAADVAAIAHGDQRGAEAALRHARGVTGRGACAHPDGTARFVVSALHALHDESDAHLRNGGCGRPVTGVLPL